MAGAGGWRALALRGYVDATANISKEMASLLIEDFDPDSIDELRIVGGSA